MFEFIKSLLRMKPEPVPELWVRNIHIFKDHQMYLEFAYGSSKEEVVIKGNKTINGFNSPYEITSDETIILARWS